MSQDDPIVNVQAKLDQTKSKQNINADLKTLQKQIDPVKLQVKVDSKVDTKSVDATTQKTVKLWESSMNALSSIWTNTMGKIANSDFINNITDRLNAVLSDVNHVKEALNSFKSVAGLFTESKNIGKCRISVRISDIFDCFEYALHT